MLQKVREKNKLTKYIYHNGFSFLFFLGVHVWNPAFDVTSAQLITGIITEHGVFKADELENKILSRQSITSSPL